MTVFGQLFLKCYLIYIFFSNKLLKGNANAQNAGISDSLSWLFFEKIFLFSLKYPKVLRVCVKICQFLKSSSGTFQALISPTVPNIVSLKRSSFSRPWPSSARCTVL